MLVKKCFVSVVAIAACMGVAFVAESAVAAVPGRAGSLRVQPGVTGSRSVSSSSVATPTVSSEPSRMATLAGMNNLGAKPKLPSGASAAAVADLQDKLSELSADVDALRNAGVDEDAVLDILDSELATKNYATVPYVNSEDSAKLDKDEFDSKFDTRADEKKLIDEDAMKDYALDKNVSFSKDDTHIIMTDGNGVTKNVALLSDLKGDKGDKGDKGEDGSVDAVELERVVNEKIDEKNLPSKDFLSEKYVTQAAYTADKETMGGNITAAQSAAENAGSKANEALLKAQSAQSSADEKLTKEQADEYYAGKDFSYSKAKVDELVAGAASGFDPDQVGAMINTAIDDKDLATNAALTELKDKVNNETTGLDATWSLASQNQTNITNLQTGKADKTDLDNYVDKPTYTADQESITSKITTAENNIVTLTANKADKDSVLPNNVKFAKQQIDNEDYYVLVNADDNSVIAPLARVEELKGEAGKEACSSLRLDPVSGDETTDKQVYNLVCVNED